jgi:hypothetical protein
MAGSRHCPSGLLLAATLGGAVLGAPPPLPAQASAAGTKLEEVVITARKEADTALTARVLKVLQDDPQRALQLARRVAGRRRVVNEIELVASMDIY